MAKFQIEGKVFSVGNVEDIPTKSGNMLRKRELVLDCSRYTCNPSTGETTRFENYPSFEFRGINCDKLDNLNLGDNIRVSFDIAGRFFTRKDGTQGHINSVDAFDVEMVSAQPVAQPAAQPMAQQPIYPQQPMMQQPMAQSQYVQQYQQQYHPQVPQGFAVPQAPQMQQDNPNDRPF